MEMLQVYHFIIIFCEDLNLNNNQKMIQFDRIRRSSLVRDKLYYLCNQIKFYSIKDPFVTGFYFLTQSLALISTFIASPLADSTSAASVLQTINSLFFFYTNDLYLRYDSQLALSHILSLLLFLAFSGIAYFTYSLDHRNHLSIRKPDLKKIKMVEMLVFILVTFSIPIGSFMWYYIMRLFQMSMEYLAIISLINLVCIFSLVYIIQECSIQSDLKNYKSLSRLYSKNQSIHSIVKMMVRMIIASFNNLSNNIIILSILALLFFDLYELRVSMMSKKFLNSTTQSIYYYKNVSTVILEVLMLFCLLTSFPLIVNNFFLSVISTSLLAFVALAQFKQNKKMNLILDGIDVVCTQDDAKIYMLQMIAMLDTSKKNQEVFTLSLITIHKEKCRLETCFCRNFNFEGFNKLIGKEQFLKRFVLSKLEGVVQKFASSFLILSILLNFKLSMMSSFSKVYYLLKTYTQKNEQALQSFSQQYMLYQVEIIIQKQIHKNNADKYVEVEKTFKEDDLRTTLTTLIHEANDAFTQKYKLLGQQICNLNLIDQLCLKISNILRAIQAIWKQFEKKDSYNLRIYQIFLVYFEYIVFSKKQAALIKTTIIRKTQALQHLKGISEQNMQRYLYTEKACVVEAIFNKDKAGIITNISSSCQQVFKFNRDQILDKDIHDLMPEYFAYQHRRWTQEWLDNQVLTGKILGLVKTHFVDSSGNTFSCSLHMKVASVGFKLKFYIMIIKDNSSDFLLLSNGLQIQGIGSKLQIQQVFEMGSLKKSIMDYTQANIKQITEEIRDGQGFKKRIVFRNQSNLSHNQKQMAFAILGASSQVSMKQPPEAYIYECQVLFQRHLVNHFIYYTLRFFQIRKLIKHNSGFLFKTILGSKNYDNINLTSNLNGSKKNFRNELYEPANRQNNLQSDNLLKQSERTDQSADDNKFQIPNMSSIAESAIGQGNIIFSKLAEQIKQKSVNHKKITDKRLNFTTVAIVLMIGVVTGCAFLQSYLFSRGMQSYNQIIFASSAVSSNNQLLQTIFNYATNLNYYCSNSSQFTRCNGLLQKYRGLTRKAFQNMISNIRVYLINKTSLTGMRYYSYYDDYINLYLPNSIISVTVKEFLQYYFYAVKNIQNLIQINTKTLAVSVKQSLKFLKINWATMKSINNEALSYYQAASQAQFEFLIFMTYFLYAIFLFTLFILLFLVNQYYGYIQAKKENIIRLHGFLTHTVCSKLRQIGDGIRQCLTKSYQQLDTTLQIQSLRQNKQKSQLRYEQNRKYNYFLAFFFTIMTIFNSIILYQITIIFSPATDMMSELTSLIQSENVALEGYLQAKSLYLFNQKQPSSPNGINEVITMINTTQIQFAVTVRNIQQTINAIGGDFADSFNYMLINDVCNLTSNYMPGTKLFGDCSLEVNYNMLQLGVVTAINFIVRNVMKAMIDLMKNVADGCIFFTSTFEDIDDYLYYLYNIYQLLEIKIMEGMDSIVSNIKQTINIIIFFEIAVLLLALLIWITRINQEKTNLSNLYAQVLQLPQVIFRQNKLILKILEENLTLKI